MSKNRSRLYYFFVSYFVLVLSGAVFPPFVNLWNKIEPHVLGLPLAQFAVILIALLLIVGLLAWFLLEGWLNARERAFYEKGASDDN